MIFALLFSMVLGSNRTQTEEDYWTMWKEFRASDRFLGEFQNEKEHNDRFEIFKDNVDTITRHNRKDLSWRMGITQFADMTPKEFKEKVVGSGCAKAFQKRAKTNAVLTKLNGKPLKTGDIATSVDWRSKVTGVKNQGGCGSCWAFSTTGAIEGRVAIKTGKLNSLSEQELVDCDTTDNGCNGGAMQNGFNYAKSNNGLSLESEYKYTAKDGTCSKSSYTHYDAITGYTNVLTTESNLKEAVATGPVSVAIEADQSSFQFYAGGVLTSNSCGTSLDHGVLAVGYGTDSSYGDYWLVKNSWGTGWGEEGYIRLCRGCDVNSGKGQCGIAMDASYPNA